MIEHIIEKYFINFNNIEIKIDINNFTQKELEIVKKLESIFVIKNKIIINGVEIIKKYTNYKTRMEDNKRIIMLPKFFGYNTLKLLNLDTELIDKRTVEQNIFYNTKFLLKPHQIKICKDIKKNLNKTLYKSYLCVAPPGCGKCMAYGTKLIMYDGILKEIQDIKVNDLLIGPDSNKRTVLSICTGRDIMYNISNLYTVNSDHILCLRYFGKPNFKLNTDKYIVKYFDFDELKYKNIIYNINNNINNEKELIYNDIIKFCNNLEDYYIKNDVLIPVKNFVLLPEDIKNKLKGYRNKIYFSNNSKPKISPYISGILFRIYDKYKKNNNIKVPYIYKINDEKVRTNFLKGFGFPLNRKNNNIFRLNIFGNQLRKDIAFMFRTLGYIINLDEYNKSIMIYIKNNFTNFYKIVVLNKGIDNYYGFTLDEDKKYVLEDCTVTHNTILSLEMIKKLKTKTLIIVPNKLLSNQWKVEIIKNLDVYEEEILIWNSANKESNLCVKNKNFKIIICVVNSSLKIEDNILQNIKIGFTIYDEIHLFSTSKFSETFWKTQSYYNLGLTATPKKMDGFEKIFIQHFGELNYVNYNVEKKFTGDVTIVINPIKYDNILTKGGTVSIPLMINKLCEDDFRNSIIIEHIINLYDKNNNLFIFVFSDRREHLIELSNKIKNIRNDISILFGGSNEEEIKYSIDSSRVIFTTYHYSSVGLNIPKMNCIILSTPRKSNHTQIIGRILRNGSDISIRRNIIDIVDKYSIFNNQYYERKKIYNENNFTIKIIKPIIADT